ncbi:hypothetical protein M3A49_40830 [Paraburkholderia sp. CNPSo 3076]|uniref:hypothetical protein n=1 Tax=Paraburkholderia sp. CNPSo 3076 TaxID=2940936 RepID=UPI00225A60E0|nr:hypothetical protein [Paraburkholderia sp. CNPSo 3076]MCX5545693.1 hypothetical protein [Paraburkholderia sp. CNPSo 3076]
MKLDKTGLLLVGGAALVLALVVKKSTGAAAGAPTQNGLGSIGSGAASFWSNVVNNVAGSPVATTSGNSMARVQLGGITEFSNGTFDASGVYVDPGQLTYNTNTGQVQESPLSGMYGILSPATYGM